MRQHRGRLLPMAATACLIAALAQPSAARVVAFEVQSSGSAFDGESFGDVGAYERIDAIVRFAVDPQSERAQDIVDIDLAPVNDAGEVEFSTEVTILRPADADAGSSVLFYEVPNRGRSLGLTLFNLVPSPSGFTLDDPGDGFLMSRGHTLVWSGWQTNLGDVLIDMELPVLTDLTDVSREEFIFENDEAVSTGTLTYPAADLDAGAATLTVRATATAPRETPEGLSFRFLDERTVEITRPENMDGGAIYELVYQARDAVPAGLAFIATSDLVSFLRGNPGHDAENPLEGIEHTIGLGISQSGRFVRDLIYSGFNEDEAGERVFDGAMPHIAGSRKTFTNYRFAQPGRYSRQHEDHDFPGDQFPFSYVETTDPVSGETDSILARCEQTDTCPRIMHTDTSTEFWQGRAALVSTSPEGETLEMPDTVRLYFLAGAPHFNAWGGRPRETATCVYKSNPMSVAPTMRALLVAMEDWVRNEAEPPASAFPTFEEETLVALDAFEMPRMAGEVPEHAFNELRRMDHGEVPPVAGETYLAAVPAVDEDGIPTGGIREALIAAPLGTYMGWNLRREGFAEGNLCSLTGSFVAFPKEEDEGDDREALADRFNGVDGYAAAVEAAAEDLVERGFMRAEDVDLVVEEARALYSDVVE